MPFVCISFLSRIPFCRQRIRSTQVQGNSSSDKKDGFEQSRSETTTVPLPNRLGFTQNYGESVGVIESELHNHVAVALFSPAAGFVKHGHELCQTLT